MGYGNRLHLHRCRPALQRQLKARCPTGFAPWVREVRLAAGAGFVVVICGNIMTMPGLPKKPAAGHRCDANGKITGLF